MQNNRKILSVVMFACFLVVVFLYIFYKSNNNIPVPLFMSDRNEIAISKIDEIDNNLIKKHDPLSEEKCRKMKINKVDDCLDRIDKENAIYKTKNLKDCLNLRSYENRNLCLVDMVRISKNAKDCSRISDYSKSEFCFNKLAGATNDIKVCDFFEKEPHEKQECIDRTIARNVMSSDDYENCHNLEILEYRKLCLQNSFKNIFNSDCMEVPEIDREYCLAEEYIYKATTNDECDLISLENYKKFCYKIVELGILKAREIDSDNDGLEDGNELFMNLDPYNNDTDSDGLLDGDEINKFRSNPDSADTDSDGLKDGDEILLGTNIQMPDTDGDGKLDGEDDDVLSGDSDNDGIPDRFEKIIGTDINNIDTDGDGVSDGDELLKYVTNPLGVGWQHDTDGDGLKDVDEVFYRTNGLLVDTDGDGISDFDEVKNMTNPLGEGDMDLDEDGLSDKEEEIYGTSPTKKDTNDDGISDYDAIEKGIEAISNDTDGDGLSNSYEDKLGYDKFNPDMDDDGLSDGDEVNKYYTDPKVADTDKDGYNDGIEVENEENPLK